MVVTQSNRNLKNAMQIAMLNTLQSKILTAIVRTNHGFKMPYCGLVDAIYIHKSRQLTTK